MTERHDADDVIWTLFAEKFPEDAKLVKARTSELEVPDAVARISSIALFKGFKAGYLLGLIRPYPTAVKGGTIMIDNREYVVVDVVGGVMVVKPVPTQGEGKAR